MNKRIVIASALAAAVAAPAYITAEAAPAPAPVFKAEKCYGIAKAGKNDCASTGNNSCAGTSQGERRPEGLDLRPGRLLRPHREAAARTPK